MVGLGNALRRIATFLIFAITALNGTAAAQPLADGRMPSTWYDGDRPRTFWRDPSEVAILSGRTAAPSAAEMIEAARAAIPEGTLLAATERLVQLRLPAGETAERLLRLSMDIGRVVPVYYPSPEVTARPYIPTGEMIVMFESPLDADGATAWGESRGLEMVEQQRAGNAFLFRCAEGSDCLAEAREAYLAEDIRYAYPNWVRPRQTRFFFRSADLAASLTASAGSIAVGDQVSFTVSVLNNGPDPATSVGVTASLPAELSLVSATTGSGSCLTFSGISCNIFSLAQGAQAEIIIIARAVANGTPVTTAAANSTFTNDPDPANNQASVTIEVGSSTGAAADLSLQKSASAATLTPGEEFVYELKVANAGPDIATGVRVSDTLPAGVDLISASATASGSCSGTTSLTCDLPDLAPGGSAAVSLTVAPNTLGWLTNTASVTTTASDPQTANNTDSVTVQVVEDVSLPNDNLFPDQWHLDNVGQSGGTPGEDVNAVAAWTRFRGSPNEVIAIVDDGLEIAHDDLAPNITGGLSIDFVGNDNDPTAGYHGTSCAGVAAAAGFNGIGVAGAAPLAGLAGIRLLGNFGVSDADEAQALTHRYDEIDAYNNSWGPIDDGQRLEGPGPLTQAALADAVTNGRGGKGSIFCWAGGNGGDNDNSNYDGYANSRYTIAVAASTNTGLRAAYSEKGANILVNAPSSGGTLAITTVDRSGNLGLSAGDYTDGFGGTSSASPLACGVVALMLQANPELTWRDVKYILATTAVQNDPADPDWIQNGAGHWVNHKYGFGRVDADAATQVAAAWTPSDETVVQEVFTSTDDLPIPDRGEVTSTIFVASTASVEFVEVSLDATHQDWGDLELVLTSPSGTESILSEPHDAGSNPDPIGGWTFTSERHLDESAQGDWTLTVRDRQTGRTGELFGWTLTLHTVGGGSTDPQADLSLSQSASPDPVLVGGQLTYTILVRNDGPASATGIRLTDDLPDSAALVSATVTPSGSCSGTASLNCDLPDLGDGENATVTVVVTPTAAGELRNQASVSANEIDPNSGNNTQTLVTTANPVGGTLQDLQVTVSGPGVVTSDPAGIDCPSDCAESYPDGSTVTLTATPASGRTFFFWLGACSGRTPTCTLEMTSDRQVRALFF